MHGLHWPESVLSYVVVGLAVGFPIVVSLAWIFDVNAGSCRTDGALSISRRSEGPAARAGAGRDRRSRGGSRHGLVLPRPRDRETGDRFCASGGKADAFHCRPPFRQSQLGQGAGVLLRRDRRGDPQRARASGGSARRGADLVLLLQGKERGSGEHRGKAARVDAAGRERAQGRRTGPHHGPVHQRRRRLPPLVEAVRPLPALEWLANARGGIVLNAPRDEIQPRARDALAAAERAIALDPEYAGGYAARGWILA